MIEYAANRFEQLMAQPDEHIDLAEAALLIAGTQYRDLEIGQYLERLDEHTGRVRARLAGNHDVQHVLTTINEYLFEEQGFEGNVDDYYDPRNTFLNDVLDRKLGVPISLSLLYLEIGQRLGLELEGIAFPGHFLVKCTEANNHPVVIDPFLKGAILSHEELEQRLDELYAEESSPRPDLDKFLAGGNKREVLMRMLRNLKAIYFQANDYEKALEISRLIFQTMPDTPVEIRDRGTIYLSMECYRGALCDYRRYLQIKQDADDYEDIRAHIVDLESLVAGLH